MKVGMNLLLWTTDVTEKHYSLLEEIKAWGFDGAEIPMFGLDEGQYRALGKQLDAIGLERTVVTIVPPEANPIDPDPAVRAVAVIRFRKIIDQCQLVGSRVLCGPFVSPVGKFVGRGRTEDEWRWAVEFFQQVAPDAQRAGIVLALEALNRFETYFVNCMGDLVGLVEAVDHPNLRLMYDTFHAHIEEKSVRDAIEAAGSRIAHVHISENDRSTPGEGQVVWHETFSALKGVGYNGWLVIEAFGQAMPDLAAATCIWRKMFPSEEHVATQGWRHIKRWRTALDMY